MNEWSYRPAADSDLPIQKRSLSELREVSLPTAVTHWISRKLTGAWLSMAHRITVSGREHLPQDTPFVMVANHTSHLDALVLGSLFPPHLQSRVFSLAAGDYFFDSPVRAIFSAQIVNALPVWRKKAAGHALQHLRSRLTHGDCGYIVFPEGTRSRDGKPGAFRPGVGMLVAETAIPIVPCLLSGCHEAWPSCARFPKRGPIHVAVMPAVHFGHCPNRKEGWTAVARELEMLFREKLER